MATTKERPMERVGVREFKAKASAYLSQGKPLTVTRHGEVLGFYIPVKRRDEKTIQRDLLELKEAIQEALEETGLSQDELADLIAQDD